MNRLIEAIKESVENKNYYAAMFMALALPDICGKIDFPGEGSKERYTKWLENNFVCDFPYKVIEPSDIYAFRCAMLHEGNHGISQQRARKIVDGFILTVADNNYVHCNTINGKMQIDVKQFCMDMANKVAVWNAGKGVLLEIDIQTENDGNILI